MGLYGNKRNLGGNVNDNFPELEGLAIAIIVLTCTAGVTFYIAYLIKGLDSTPFWILLNFIQLVYLMRMLEVHHPRNLLYFLDKLDPCKLDLNFIDEFTGLRNEIIKEISFRPDRASFSKIDWQYGSVLVNLFFYGRLIFLVIVAHIVLKIILIFKNEQNPIWNFVQKVKDYISHIFYIRYVLEISLFLWTAIFIEFVSTGRNSGSQKLSLVFAINILLFMLYLTFSFLFAFYVNNTNETYRGYFYSYFLMKRGIIPICLVSFAYTSQEWQLSAVLIVQILFTVVEILLTVFNKSEYSKKIHHPGQSLINSSLSIGCNLLFTIYLALMFMFLDKNPPIDDKSGEALAYFISACILLVGVLVILFAIIRLFLIKRETVTEESDESANNEIVNLDEGQIQKIRKDEENQQNEAPDKNKSVNDENHSRFKEGTSPESSVIPNKYGFY